MGKRQISNRKLRKNLKFRATKTKHHDQLKNLDDLLEMYNKADTPEKQIEVINQAVEIAQREINEWLMLLNKIDGGVIVPSSDTLPNAKKYLNEWQEFIKMMEEMREEIKLEM